MAWSVPWRKGVVTGRHAPATMRMSVVSSARPSKHARIQESNTRLPGVASISLNPDRLYTDGTYLPDATFSPAAAILSVPGKGRGVVLTQDINLGQLVLISQPAGKVVCGPEGAVLGGEHLLAAWEAPGALTSVDKQRLGVLFGGPNVQQKLTAGAFLALLQQQHTADSTHKVKRVRKPVSAARGFGAPAADPPTAATAPQGGEPETLTQQHIQDVVRYNAWGQVCADFGAAPLRGQASQSYIGVWPEFSLLNHSCVPSCVAAMVGDRVVVRAALPLPKATEATINYLGQDTCSPLAVRRERLQEQYGFECACPRCQGESKLPDEVQCLVDDMWGWVKDGTLGQRVKQLVATDDLPALQTIQAQLQQHVSRLEALMVQHELAPQVRLWVRASCFCTYELLAVVRDTQEQAAVRAAQQQDQQQQSSVSVDPSIAGDLAVVLGAVSPGSDAHLYMLLEWLENSSARNKGVQVPAGKLCLSAHVSRYGSCSEAVLTQLMIKRSSVGYKLGRVDLPTAPADVALPHSASVASDGVSAEHDGISIFARPPTARH